MRQVTDDMKRIQTELTRIESLSGHNEYLIHEEEDLFE